MKPLTVGNVVSAGLRIYRDRFSSYYRLAFIGSLWSYIPIYGWAKLFANMGVISRLAFKELNENPEPEKEAVRHVKPRLWKFLGAFLLVTIRFFIAWFLYLFGFILLSILGAFLVQFFNNPVVGIILGLLIILASVFLVISFFRIIARYFIYELPIAIEDDVTAGEAIKRSIELTRDNIFRIQIIVLIASLVTFPIFGVNIAASFLQQAINNSAEYQSWFKVLSYIVSSLLMTALGALIIPFWQSIKAVIYYDLRVRREGLGIELEENN